MHRELIPPSPAFLRRVRLKNYKSIATCDVRLGRLVALVGRNGSGKSNFLDSLRFVADGLTTTLDHALRERGGLAAGAAAQHGASAELHDQLGSRPVIGIACDLRV
jgi:predicted ATPase